MDELRKHTQLPRGLSDSTAAQIALAAFLGASDDTVQLFFEDPLRSVHYPRVLHYVEQIKDTDSVPALLADVLPLCSATDLTFKRSHTANLSEIARLAATAPQSVRPVNSIAQREALLWLSVAVCSRLPRCIDCMQCLLTRMPAAFTAHLFEAVECAQQMEQEEVQLILETVTAL